MPLWCNGCERWVANSDTDSSAAHYDCPGKQEPRLGENAPHLHRDPRLALSEDPDPPGDSHQPEVRDEDG